MFSSTCNVRHHELQSNKSRTILEVDQFDYRFLLQKFPFLSIFLGFIFKILINISLKSRLLRGQREIILFNWRLIENRAMNEPDFFFLFSNSWQALVQKGSSQVNESRIFQGIFAIFKSLNDFISCFWLFKWSSFNTI